MVSVRDEYSTQTLFKDVALRMEDEISDKYVVDNKTKVCCVEYIPRVLLVR